jgi:hypothetical protein
LEERNNSDEEFQRAEHIAWGHDSWDLEKVDFLKVLLRK